MSSPADLARYEVWKSVNGGVYSLLGSTTGNSYPDSSIVEGNTYSYYLIIVDLYQNQDSGDSASMEVPLSRDSGVSTLLNTRVSGENKIFTIINGKVISDLDKRYDVLKRY